MEIRKQGPAGDPGQSEVSAGAVPPPSPTVASDDDPRVPVASFPEEHTFDIRGAREPPDGQPSTPARARSPKEESPGTADGETARRRVSRDSSYQELEPPVPLDRAEARKASNQPPQPTPF